MLKKRSLCCWHMHLSADNKELQILCYLVWLKSRPGLNFLAKVDPDAKHVRTTARLDWVDAFVYMS